MNGSSAFKYPLPQGLPRGLSRAPRLYEPLRSHHSSPRDYAETFKARLRWLSQRPSTFASPVLVKELFLAIAKPLFIRTETQRQRLQLQSTKAVPLPKKAASGAGKSAGKGSNAGGGFAAAAMRLLSNISSASGAAEGPTRTNYGFWNACSCPEPKKFELV